MRINSTIKRKARGLYYWHRGAGILEQIQRTFRTKIVSKKEFNCDIFNDMFKWDLLDNIKRRDMIQDGFIMGYIKPGDKIEFNDNNEMIINGE